MGGDTGRKSNPDQGSRIKKVKQYVGAPLWSEVVFRELADNIIDGVYCINTDGYFAFVNRAIIERSGISPDKFYASHFLDIVHPAYRELGAQNFQRVMGGESCIPYELRYESGNGQERIVEVNSKPIRSDGKVIGLLGISRDITERKLTEERIKASERQFRTLIESIPTAIFVYEGSKFSYLNPACERITGYTRDELYLLDVWEIVHPDHRDVIREYVHRRQQGGSVPARHEFKIITKSGDERWLERVTIAVEMEGKPLILLAATDITEHKQTKDTLEGLVRDRAAERNTRNEQMVREIKERKRAKAAMRRKGRELKLYAKKLEDLNAALKVLLKRREEDKAELEEKIISNVKEIVEPYVKKLKKTQLNMDQSAYVNIIETNLNGIISPVVRNLASKHPILTSRQIQIAELIMARRTTKEIADIMNSSKRAIDFHRNKIRTKLGLKKKNVTLRSHLLSIS